MRPAILAVSVLTLLPSCVLTLDEVGPPVVQRPTLSQNTDTTLPGGVSLEMGAEVGPRGRRSVPTTIRWGAGRDSEVTLGGDLIRRSGGESGSGDLEVGMRQRLVRVEDGVTGWSWGWLTRIPTASADRGLGSGEVDAQLNVSRDRLRGVSTITQYAQLDLLGNPDGAGTDIGWLGAVAVSRPLGGGYGLVAEGAGRWVPERDEEGVFLTGALTMQLDEWSLVDVGVRLGFGDDAEDWTLFVGFGRSIGRLTAGR